MNNKKIVIDAGHGGSDPGATANNIVEKDYTLLISKYIYDKLKSLGVDVSITRDSDITLNPSDRVKKILNFYGNGKDVIVISNHINAGGGSGAEVIYSLRNNDKLSKLISKELENNGQNVRKYYQRRLPSNPSRDYYYILRDTANNESVIVEYAFIDNKQDAEKLKNNWQKYADAVVSAIGQYIGIQIEDKDTYIVKSGDTLWSIAKKNNLSVDNLKKYNNLKSNLLFVGQTLKLSAPKTPVTEDDAANKYVVKPGDNLYAISKMYKVSVDDLKKVNNINNDIISIGQILTIPPSNNQYETYEVKKGDTLYSIARRFNTTVSNIQLINNLETSILSIGQKLLVPID
jgi:LysM repeat protein